MKNFCFEEMQRGWMSLKGIRESVITFYLQKRIFEEKFIIYSVDYGHISVE